MKAGTRRRKKIPKMYTGFMQETEVWNFREVKELSLKTYRQCYNYASYKDLRIFHLVIRWFVDMRIR